MKPSINLRYKSLLLTCLLIFSTGVAVPAWGQTYTINYKNGSPQTGITERVDTVYVADGEERELFIPELRNNDGFYNANYRWYVRWYQLNEGNLSCENIKGKAINPKLDGSFVQGGALQDLINLYPSSLRDAGTSLFFYKDFYKIEGTTAINSSVPLGASTVEYSAVNVKEDLVVCDVSLNNNYKVDGTTFTEPTLSIRYKFVIRPASEIANRIKDSKADETTPFMDETIYVPQNNGTINIQLGRIANNYAWYDGDQIVQGETYQYKKDNGEWKDLGNRWTQIINNLITVGTQPVKLEIRAVGKDKTKASPLLVRYNLIPGDHGFMLQEKQEKDSDPRRNPDNYPEFYERIGYINFDRNDSISVDDLNSVNNMAKIGFSDNKEDKGKWLDPEITGYAPFNYQIQPNKDNRIQTLQNQYGLFRTADVEKVSTNNEKVEGKTYFWFASAQSKPKVAIYDRTYYNTGKKSLGYFFYVDAANLPGTFGENSVGW